jgi:hypothetical protein
MPKPAFAKLSGLWTDDPGAARLIADYAESARRSARRLDRRYPGCDFEPPCMEGLYTAAFTHRPGRAAFGRWLRWNIRNATSSLKATAVRRRRLAMVSSCDPAVLDELPSGGASRRTPTTQHPAPGAVSGATPQDGERDRWRR